MHTDNVSGQRWEYHVVRSDDLSVLETFEREGWELVSVSSVVKAAQQPTSRPRFRIIPSRGPLRYAFFAVLALVASVVLLFTFVSRRPLLNELPISSLVEDVRAGKITKIVAQEESNKLVLCYGDCRPGQVRIAHKEGGISVLEILDRGGISREKWPVIEVEPAPTWGSYLGLLFACLPILLLVAVLVAVNRLTQRLMRLAQETELLIIFRRAKT